MASLNTLKTKFGFLISGLIAVVLVIFALNIDSNTFVDQPTEDEINGPTVFTIAGDEVKHSEYGRLRELYSELQTLNYFGQIVNLGHDQGAFAALQTLVFDRYSAPAFEKVGVYASDAEIETFTTAKYRDMRAQYAQSELTPEQVDLVLSIQWGTDMYFVGQQLANDKFSNIASKGLYLNKLEVANALRNDKLTFDGVYVEIPYTAIADKDVTVTDEEIAAYYEANRKQNDRYDSRTIRYVRFERQATDEDKAAIEAEVKALDAKVAASKDAEEIKRAVRAAGGKVQSYYAAFDGLQKEVSDAFKAGKAYGPEVKNNVWTARYLISDITAPESYDVEIASFEDAAKAAKVVEELKANGGDFKKLQEAAEVNAQVLTFAQMPVSETQHFLGRKEGDIFTFNSSGVDVVVKINKVAAAKRYVLTANLDREIVASDDTNRKVLSQVDEFSSKMGNTVESFTEAAKGASKSALAATVTRADVLSGRPSTVQSIPNSTSMAHWALGAKVGDTKQFVIDGVTYVVMVSNIDTEKFEARNDSAIRRKLMQQKKYDMIASKVNSLDEAKAMEGAKTENFAGVKFADNTPDLHLVGAIAATKDVQKVQKVQGDRAAYVFVVNKINGEVDPATYDAERVPLTEKAAPAYNNGVISAFMNKANVKDHRTDTTY